MPETHRHSPLVIFGDDGSPGADLAWLWLNSQRWSGWTLHTMTAMLDLSGRLERALAPTEHNHGVRCPFVEADFLHHTAEVSQSDPRLALSRPCDLLVVGWRGRGFWKSLHLGSTAEFLLVHPPAPLVIARHGRHVRSVLVAHDGSDHAGAAVRALCSWPGVGSTQVEMLSVGAMSADAAANVRHAVAACRDHGAQVTRTELDGDPADRIVGEIESTQPDLVVLGTHGLTGFERARVGSVASTIVHRTRASILIACNDPDSIANAGDLS